MVKVGQAPPGHNCPDCGTVLDSGPVIAGLCPHCLLELALEESPLRPAMVDDPEAAPTMAYPGGALSPGQILGNRYQIRSLLGRGGMGEVWRAFDLKLRVDVALKALHQHLLAEERALETLRQEVRTAREVVSPNVCRVFDLVEIDGQELVSMEYIDGTTLQDVLKARSPLALDEAREIAAQFLAGLEAIHDAGLVHRDMKPENVMLTRAGRAVVMDFGIAKGLAEGHAGTVAGTPAYMAPEQARGEAVDARADVFSVGVMLAEMGDPAGVRGEEARQAVWRGVQHEPPELADSPWLAVVKKAVARIPEQRYASAAGLARALEEVTLRVAGAEDVRPYPGLASFTADDAEYFFGRELEVEAMWKKLRRPHLLGLIGPSGAGKSSFLRAGLLPAMPEGWAAVIFAPGNRPSLSLGQTLAREFAGDVEAIEQLLAFDQPDVATSLVERWRERHDQALIIVDQFEELFTQNPPEVQASFADLLARLALEADVHLLLSMRDDFLYRCHAYPSLAPMLDGLTLLSPPTGAALRRAVVQPALKCGYRFEDEALIEQILGEVEHERGALPMLAFAAARLWEHRDREAGVLTREAYEYVGGVGGSLAQHAEATLERVGAERLAVVRELFRNLVTAEGTRAARDREDLLSVFTGDAPYSDGTDDRQPTADGAAPAATVLDTLIDARLLTSYELAGSEEAAAHHHRIEIIHESLLSAWPRLVRWQTQDADSAQLRDQVRQAAQLWEERGRSEDLLWTGTSFKEYEIWRERYAGGLSAAEEAFAAAMKTRAERRRKRRRLAVTTVVAVLLAVIAVIALFWRRSVEEALRADAANLLSIGRTLLEDYPTAAVAYATASLERVDNPDVRLLALEALWRGPTEFRLPTPSSYMLDFTPDGRWLATGSVQGAALWPADGGPPQGLESSEVAMEFRISPRGDLIAALTDTERQTLGLWSLPEGRYLRSFDLGETMTFSFRFSPDSERLITSTETWGGENSWVTIRSWSVDGGEPEILGRRLMAQESIGAHADVDPLASRFAWLEGKLLKIAPFAADDSPPLLLEHERAITGATFGPNGGHVATLDKSGGIRVWSLEGETPNTLLTFRQPGSGYETFRFDNRGSMVAHSAGLLWRLDAPPGADPLRLRTLNAAFGGGTRARFGLAFAPDGRWFAHSGSDAVSLWPLSERYPLALTGHETFVRGLGFTADGEKLISTSQDGTVRVWPLAGESGDRPRILHRAESIRTSPIALAVSADGLTIVTGSTVGQVAVRSIDGGSTRELEGFSDVIYAVAVGPEGRLVAAGAGAYIAEEAVVRIWDLETAKTRVLDAGGRRVSRLEFLSRGTLLASSDKYRLWNLETDPPRLLSETEEPLPNWVFDFGPAGNTALVSGDGLRLDDLQAGTGRELGSRRISSAAFDPTGEVVVSGDTRGVVRVETTGSGEPHLLFGHKDEVHAVAVSQDGRWIASGGDNGTIRLWPMPDLSQPPLHTLARNELLAKLRSLTNLRVVEDLESSTGWKLEIGPFPGWEEVPTW